MNQEIHTILIKELNIEALPVEAQNEIVSRLGEIILKSITVAIFENLSPENRQEFEVIAKTGDQEKIQGFLTANVVNLPDLMNAEVRKVLEAFKQAEQGSNL